MVSTTSRLRSLIGQTTEERNIAIEQGQIRRFAAAIGESDPLHFDIEAAQARGFSSLVAPPTFASALIPPELFLDTLGWDVVSVLHRSEEYEYYQPICAGDTLAVTHELGDIYEEGGGKGSDSLLFAVIETCAKSAKGQLVFKGRRVLVRRMS